VPLPLDDGGDALARPALRGGPRPGAHVHRGRRRRHPLRGQREAERRLGALEHAEAHGARRSSSLLAALPLLFFFFFFFFFFFAPGQFRQQRGARGSRRRVRRGVPDPGEPQAAARAGADALQQEGGLRLGAGRGEQRRPPDGGFFFPLVACREGPRLGSRTRRRRRRRRRKRRRRGSLCEEGVGSGGGRSRSRSSRGVGGVVGGGRD
jgi:hypothetical protein